MKTYKVISIGCAVVALFFACTPINNAGTVTQTGNPTIAGILYAPGGKAPAVHATVYIRKKSALADTAGSGLGKTLVDTATVTTNDSGIFRIDSLDTGTYVIEGASGNNLALIDSVPVKSKDSTVTLPPDTLKPAGAIKGVIRLSEGGDTRKVFILAFGIDRFARVNADGSFKFSNLAEAVYDLQIISSLDDYGVLDTPNVVVTAAETTDVKAIDLPFTGIPTPKNVTFSYDTLKQIVTLTWSKADTTLVKSYNVYRRNVDSNTVPVRINASPVADTVYRDSTGVQGTTYEYMVAAVNKSTTEGTKSAGVSVNVVGAFIVIDSIVKGYAANVDGNFGGIARGVLDKAGNFYIVDNTNNWLQKIGATGNFVFKVASFSVPISIANYSDSFLFICDYNARKIIKTDLIGVIDTSFSTIGRPSGVCIRGDSVFISSDSGIVIHDLNGKQLKAVRYSFSTALSLSNVIASNDGKLYAIEDRGVFEVDIQAQTVKSIWSFSDQYANQQAMLCQYNGDTLAIISSGGNAPFFSSLYFISTSGNLIAKSKLRYGIGGITKSTANVLIGFSSDGKILSLTR